MVVVTIMQRQAIDIVRSYSLLASDDIARELQSFDEVDVFMSRDVFDDIAMMDQAYKMNHAASISDKEMAYTKTDRMQDAKSGN